MPELPDLEIYAEQIAARIVGQPLRAVEIRNAFVLRTAVPPLSALEGHRVEAVRRMGKQVVIRFEGELFAVIHLMRAGRFKWLDSGARAAGRGALALLHFPTGSLLMTEAGTRRRASLRVVAGERDLRALDPGGLEVLEATLPEFAARLRSANHTAKRALTDGHLFSGIGGAYADEILFRAQLSPVALTGRFSEAEVERLYRAAREVLRQWTQQLRTRTGQDFPERVTAFRDGMAVHGRYGKPCPVCATPVQRILYAETETNYCPRCQTGGKILADRALSRLLHDSWPRTVDEME